MTDSQGENYDSKGAEYDKNKSMVRELERNGF